MNKRTMAGTLNNSQLMEARVTLGTLLEKQSLEAVLGGAAPVDRGIYAAVYKASSMFTKNKMGFGRIRQITLWNEGNGKFTFDIFAGPGLLWSFPVVEVKAPAPVVVKPMPTATPKRVDGSPAMVVTRESLLTLTPVAAQPDAVTPVARKGDCEGCQMENARFMVETMGKKGDSLFRNLCTGCHGKASSDRETFIDAVAIA